MRSISQVLGLILLAGGAAMAEMQVELKDGRKLTIPFEQNEIAGITVDGKPMRLVDDNAPSRPSATAQQRAGASGLQAGLATEQPTTENGRRILRVGPGREFQLPSEAAAAAQDGDPHAGLLPIGRLATGISGRLGSLVSAPRNRQAPLGYFVLYSNILSPKYFSAIIGEDRPPVNAPACNRARQFPGTGLTVRR